MNKLHRKILIGDVLEKMLEIPDESIDVIISSPPYWGLRDYGADGQWGLEKDFNEYLDKLDKLMDQCKRVLKPTGTCWINLGDTYSTVSGGMKDLKNGVKKKYGKLDYGVGHAHTGDGKPELDGAFSVDQAKMYNNLQSKSRVGIPERFYIRCIDKGWIARNHIPWVKANSMPSSVKDRFTNKWESVFFFAKNQKYYFNLDAVRVEPITKIKPKPFNRRIRDAKRLENMNQEGAIVGAEMTEQEKLNTDKLGNKLKQDNVLGADGKPKANYKGFNARWQEKMNGVRIKISDIQETIVGETIEYDKSKPYAVQERAGIIAYRDLPPHNEIRLYLQEARKKENMTVKQLEELFGKSCHHWFEDHTKPRSTPSFPTADDWFKLKKILKLDDKFDLPMQTLLYKRAEKQDNPKGKNPGDVFETEVSRLEQEVYGKDDMKNGRRSRVLGFLNTTGRKQNANPNGKNPGDIFNINTKPFPKAHFATFPPALPEKILKCSCPKQVCNKCGKPREPITKVVGKQITEAMKYAGCNKDGEYNGKGQKDYEGTKAENPSDAKSRILESMSQVKQTIGYTDCGCNAGFKAGIALDPFFGAGTVGLVAEELGLDWVGIELKEEYTKIARERLEPYTKITRLDKI